MEPKIDISLAQEELLFLLQALRIPSLPGLPSDLIEGLNRETYLLMMSIAERTLRAHELLRFNGDQAVIDEAISGTLAFCANSPFTIALSRNQPGEPELQVMYHVSEPLKVRRHVVAGVHHFALIPSAESLLLDMMRILQGGAEMTPSDDIEPISVSGGALVTARVAGSQTIPDDQLATVFEQNGVSPENARILTGALRHDLIASAAIGVLAPAENAQTDLLSVALFQEKNGWWVVREVEAGENELESRYEMVRIQPDELYAYLTDALATYLAAPVSV